jgi:hypothetical protein
VTKSRASKLFDFVARRRSVLVAAFLGAAGVLVAVGCSRPMAAPAAVDVDVERPGVRRAGAVVLEPPPARPDPVERTGARGIVSLREPIARAAVERFVERFFAAWQRGSLEGLTVLLASDAEPLYGNAHGRSSVIENWQQRLQAHEYPRLAGLELVRPERIERWSWDDLSAPDAPRRPFGMRPGDIVVRVPVEVTQAAGERFFGDVAVLMVRRDGDDLLIAGYGEIEGSEAGFHGARP